ncbi:MAG: leucine-rich repeat domain-containing protein [Clostridiales bacterium]|nr:leucine-rich repeat domain-containing protein [Clostridiales bacterium]
MKKWVLIISVLSVMLGAAICFTACNDSPVGAHDHSATSYEITKKATCTEAGERTGVCVICGETFTDPIPATGHDRHLQYETEATCTQAGEAVYACANCFELDTKTTPALGHDESVVIAAVPAGCETVGFTEGKSCSRCGDIVVAPVEVAASGHELYYENYGYDTHSVFCRNCNYSEIDECAFEEIEILPTCTEAGKLIHTCALCGDNHEHETASALGHLWNENILFFGVVDGVYKHRKSCYRCEAYEDDNCSNAAGETVRPTCETVGYTEYACGICGNEFESDFKDKLGHDWTDFVLDGDTPDPYSHTHSRYCKRAECGTEEKGVIVGTVGTVVGVRTDRTCVADAFTVYTCSLASCTYSRTQTDEGTALGHNWGEWLYSGDNDEHHTHTHYCLRSGCSEEETKDCRMVSSSQAATCTKPQVDTDVCEDCFHVDRDEGVALGHKWSNWINVNLVGTLQHTRVCSVCNTREYGTHSYEVTTRPADCEHNSATVNTCSVCGHTAVTEHSGTAFGHDWTLEDSTATTHTLICSIDPSHTVTEAHDYSSTNICKYDGTDGLTYELAGDGRSYTVKNANGLGRATEIIIPSFRQSPNSSEKIIVGAIGKSAFAGNGSIVKIKIPATVTVIAESAFINCSALTAVEFYDGASQLTRIEHNAFYGCKKLTDITLPDNLVYIGTIAFDGCTSLESIVMPDSVTDIGINAFYNTALFNNRSNWTGGALYLGKFLIKADRAYFTDTVTEFVIKDGTTVISEYAFDNCTGLLSVTVPISVMKIGTDAFGGCTDLNEVVYKGSVMQWFGITFASATSSPMYYAKTMSIQGEVSSELVIPDVASIPAGTFKGNTTLTKVTIPSTVTFIGDEAFMNCSLLAEIEFIDDHITYMGKNAFCGTSFYNSGSNWNEGVLILGNHILATNDDFTATEYVIADNIRTVSADAFYSRNITNITIGSGVVWIGAGAFNYQSLVSVTFVKTTGSWLAKNKGGAVRSVTVTADAAANADLIKNYQGEWRRA